MQCELVALRQPGSENGAPDCSRQGSLSLRASPVYRFDWLEHVTSVEFGMIANILGFSATYKPKSLGER
jgi:hypothetical protein